MRMSSRLTCTQWTARKSASKTSHCCRYLIGLAEGLHEHPLPAHLLAVVVGELAGAGADVGELLFALGDVAHDLEAAFTREPRDGLIEAAGDGVGRVGRQAD